MAKKYKYECRPCLSHTRRLCIEQARISPGIKRIIERAFESHTDTQATWDLLQANCLLVQRDEMVIGRSEVQQHGLLDRMRKSRQEAAQEDKSEAPPEKVQEPPPVVRPPSVVEPDQDVASRPPRLERPAIDTRTRFTSKGPPTSPEPTRLQRPKRLVSPIPPPPAERVRPVSRTAPSAATSIQYPAVSRPVAPQFTYPGPRMLVAQVSGHRILLPEEGRLTLGRFDPLSRVTPDVDLTFEDQWHHWISRRHAQILGRQGQYELTDLGSSNGTWLNGKRLSTQSNHTLRVSDEVRLGNCVLFFDQGPELWNMPSPVGQYFVYVTFTGHYFALPPKDTIIIGRGDPSLDFEPDIDLSQEGDVASVVSRRHAKLIRDGDQFLIEDLGSANKTRINGQPVYMGMQMPIKPGQHLWLGGCILALDIVEIPDTAD